MELTGHSVRIQPRRIPSLPFLLSLPNVRYANDLLQKEVFAVRFDPTGQNIASGSFDRSICKSLPRISISLYFLHSSLFPSEVANDVIVVWRTYGDCPNYLALPGHKGAVLDLHWSRDSQIIFSASADTLLATWDVSTGGRIRRYVGHEDVVNAMDVTRRGPELMVSGSDDGSIGVCRSLGYASFTGSMLKIHF